MKDKRARKCLAAGLYSSRKSCNFKYISDTGSPITYHKISSGGHSNESDIKAILPRALLVRFLLTGLSPGMPSGGRFRDMINYALEPLAMLEIYKDTIKETYI